MQYRSGEILRPGDIFTTIWDQGSSNPRQFVVSPNGLQHAVYLRPTSGLHVWWDHDADNVLESWILLRRGNRTKTGFQKFVQKIEGLDKEEEKVSESV